MQSNKCPEILIKDQKDEIFILKASLIVVHDALDILISACLDEKGKPKSPDIRDIMKARGMLPKGYTNSFPEKKEKKNAN